MNLIALSEYNSIAFVKIPNKYFNHAKTKTLKDVIKTIKDIADFLLPKYIKETGIPTKDKLGEITVFFPMQTVCAKPATNCLNATNNKLEQDKIKEVYFTQQFLQKSKIDIKENPCSVFVVNGEIKEFYSRTPRIKIYEMAQTLSEETESEVLVYVEVFSFNAKKIKQKECLTFQ